ncbi:MAG TPA: hypothetical protein VNZ22_14795, partial [Bacillota bacterium]|nr:hypothetical protein [Bacillota bacterium]
GQTKEQSLVFRFGLPRTPPAKLWREGEVLRGLWVTNGVRYTETVLLTPVNGNGRSNLVLLVNIQGENTNSEYAEAAAELVLETGRQQQELELKEGLLWRVEGGVRSLIGALEIPQSGVKVAQGKTLQFAGNMPPSEKGSMTLKIPLEPLESNQAAEWLSDLEFAAELRQAIKPRKETLPFPSQKRLVFAREDNSAEVKLDARRQKAEQF